ncbi:DUF1376 domain-containing protein [Enterobacter asburiae]|uniref:DUF1376 domain-containing protein n=1 Tax=Enterobacter asburiae TaxID=61645 RepID=UPI0028892A0C|nr:DUF1376 domain-containing protein [Enterobacter asburiae]WNI61737.1 DUF1376 domain-containing protein [Enterobacter asburiae]WNI65865.1 DUF1376 domain-containing protein [Enterobacter asburiae]
MPNYWQTGRPIPIKRLSKIARLSNDCWDAVEPSLKEFFNDTGTEWVQERIERDLEAVKNSISQKSAAGKASAQARKAKKGEKNQQNSNERSTGVNAPFEQIRNGNSTNTDTALKEKEERELSAQESFFPAIGKFPITDDWMPSDDIVGQAAQWGINLGDHPGIPQWNSSSSAITESAKGR